MNKLNEISEDVQKSVFCHALSRCLEGNILIVFESWAVRKDFVDKYFPGCYPLAQVMMGPAEVFFRASGTVGRAEASPVATVILAGGIEFSSAKMAEEWLSGQPDPLLITVKPPPKAVPTAKMTVLVYGEGGLDILEEERRMLEDTYEEIEVTVEEVE